MTFVVTDAGIRCKYMDCVIACPADCFREGEEMLVADPDNRIDCAPCWRVCPAAAVGTDSESGMEGWVAFNRQFAAQWPARRKLRQGSRSSITPGAGGVA